jgi:hypothetical protein
MRYIEENPVRAGMVVNPADYRWSSHLANAFGKRGFGHELQVPPYRGRTVIKIVQQELRAQDSRHQGGQ